jgi:hypothetical protein
VVSATENGIIKWIGNKKKTVRGGRLIIIFMDLMIHICRKDLAVILFLSVNIFFVF